MSAVAAWFGGESGEALLLALAHSVWLAGLLLGLCAAIFRAIPAGRAGLRYGILLGAQGMVAVGTIGIWSLLSPGDGRPAATQGEPLGRASVEVGGPVETTREAEGPSGPMPGLRAPTDAPASDFGTAAWPQWIGTGWSAGALCVLLLRLVGFWRTVRVCRFGTVIETGLWRDLLEAERARFGYRRAVALRAVECLGGPAAFGLFRPVILIPASMATGLPTETMRAILIHELAHLRRWDPLVQAMQQVFEALFFFNPFVWILSRQIAVEREACCDARVARFVDAGAYAQALLDFGRGRGMAPAALAAGGDGSPSSLGERIRRLLRPGERADFRFSPRLFLLALGLAGLGVVAGRQAADAAVEAFSHREVIQRIQTALDLERRERLPVEWQAGDRMRVEGSVTDSEGRPIPGAEVGFRLYYPDGREGYTTTASADPETGAYERVLNLTDYTGDARPYAAVSLTAVAPGHNVVALDRVPLGKGPATFDFRLEKGIPVEVVVRDEAGDPVAGATVRMDYLGFSVDEETTGRTDGRGRASLHVPEEQAFLVKVSADGFQDATGIRSTFTEAGEVLEVTLEPGDPVRGLVRDAETGEPIEGAGVFRIQSISPAGNFPAGRSFWVGQDDPMVRTGPDGGFVIHSLEKDRLHWLVVQKEGYLVGFSGPGDARAKRWLDASFAVSPGGDPVEIGLWPRQELELRILPPAGWLKDDDSKEEVRWSHSYITGLRERPSHNRGSGLNRRTVAPAGGELRFRIQPTMAAPLRIGLGHLRGPEQTVEGWQFGEPLVVDLRNEPIVAEAAVDYRIRFDLEEGAPEAAGSLQVDYVGPGFGSGQTEVPLVDGEARFTLTQRLDRSVEFDARGVVGYYFKQVRLEPPGSLPTATVEHRIKDARPAGAIRLKLLNLDPEAGTELRVEQVPGFWHLGGEARPLWPLEPVIRLPAGETEALLTAVPFDTTLRLRLRNGNMEFESTPLRLAAGEAIKSKTIRLPDGDRVSGRLLLPDGNPAAGVHLSLNRVHDLSDRSYRTSHFGAVTDREGRFRFDRVNGDMEGIFYLNASGIDGAAALKQIIRVPSEGIELRPAPSADLRVRVVVAGTGEPVAGLDLEAFRSDLPENRRFFGDFLRANGASDTDGWTRFVGLPAEGRYQFRIWIPGENSRSAYTSGHDLPAVGNGERLLVIEVPPGELNDRILKRTERHVR